MKTPDEIKRGLAMCSHGADCGHCPYTLYECSKNQMEQDALSYIQQLEERLGEVNKMLESQVPESRKPEDCRYYTPYHIYGSGCLATKEIDLCEGATCKRWKPKEEFHGQEVQTD